MKEITACTMDCPDACSIIVSSDGNGSISVRGNPDHPVTAGYTCRKIRKHVQRLKSSERILYPMRKTPKGWQRISWDAAFDVCGQKIQECRNEPSAILHIYGSGAKGVLKEATKLFFHQLGARRVRGSLCDSAGILAYFRDMGSRNNHDIKDLMNAKGIINWGKDLSRSSIHMAAVVKKARRGGTKVLTISPGGDGNDTASDHRIRIRPGTDRFLAAAVILRFIEKNRIPAGILHHTKRWETFDEMLSRYSVAELAAACDVTPSMVDVVFDWYVRWSPAASIVGAGLQRYAYGGETVRFINALTLVSGNVGKTGGGSYFHHHAYRNLDLSWIEDANRKQYRSLKLPLIGREILEADDPPVEMIWVNCTNIINQAADSGDIVRAFEKVPFKVVVDAFFNDTVERADLVLPAKLMFEQEDIIGSYLHEYVHHVKAVCPTVGEAKDDYSILRELGRRLMPPILLPDTETCLKTALQTPFLDISIDALRKHHFARAHRPAIAYEGLRFDHFDGKYRFPIELHPEPAPPDGFPLRLLTLIRQDVMHSQMLAEDQRDPLRVWIAPDCAAWTQLEENKDIYLTSPKGRLKVRIHGLDGLHREAVLYRRGDWMKLGGGANQLIEADLTDMGTGSAFYDQYVRLENGESDCPIG